MNWNDIFNASNYKHDHIEVNPDVYSSEFEYNEFDDSITTERETEYYACDEVIDKVLLLDKYLIFKFKTYKMAIKMDADVIFNIHPKLIESQILREYDRKSNGEYNILYLETDNTILNIVSKDIIDVRLYTPKKYVYSQEMLNRFFYPNYNPINKSKSLMLNEIPKIKDDTIISAAYVDATIKPRTISFDIIGKETYNLLGIFFVESLITSTKMIEDSFLDIGVMMKPSYNTDIIEKDNTLIVNTPKYEFIIKQYDKVFYKMFY